MHLPLTQTLPSRDVSRELAQLRNHTLLGQAPECCVRQQMSETTQVAIGKSI